MTGVSVGEIGQRIGGLLGKANQLASGEQAELRSDSALAAMQRARLTMDRGSDGAVASSNAGPGAGAENLPVAATAVSTGGSTVDPSLADFPVTPEEVAAALGDGTVPRLVVVSTTRRRRSKAAASAPGAMRLGRAMRSRDLSTIVIDLGRNGNIAPSLGGARGTKSRKLPGLDDWLRGRVELAEAIHRDPDSGVHVVPSGGFDVLNADNADVADLVFFVVACCGVYDCVLMSCGPESIDLLPALLDDDAALILDGGHDGHRSIAGAIGGIGITEWLDLAPEAAELS